MTKMFTFRAEVEWIEMMKRYAAQTPLTLSTFIQYASKIGGEELIKRFPKEDKNEEIQLHIQV